MLNIGQSQIRLLAVVLGLWVALAAPVAEAHTCGSNWCSGSDGNTTSNQQGNGPQVYVGEVSTYQNDFYGTHGIAWSDTAANSAQSRFTAGTGIGIEDYYFGGGSGANNQGISAYCFGALQGYHETYDMYVYHRSYLGDQYLSFLDIEDPIATWGWPSTEKSANRDVFNGWSDYVAGRGPCSYGANANDKSQYGVYSSPSAWNNAINSGIPNTYVWTYQTGCSTAWPGANWGGKAKWFGGSNYDWSLQFDQDAQNCGTKDWDDAYEPDTLPVLNNTVLGQ